MPLPSPPRPSPHLAALLLGFPSFPPGSQTRLKWQQHYYPLRLPPRGTSSSQGIAAAERRGCGGAPGRGGARQEASSSPKKSRLCLRLCSVFDSSRRKGGGEERAGAARGLPARRCPPPPPGSLDERGRGRGLSPASSSFVFCAAACPRGLHSPACVCVAPPACCTRPLGKEAATTSFRALSSAAPTPPN